MRRLNPGIGCLLALTAGLVGCAPKTNVSTTGNVPAAYSHVFMSVQEIWFNTNAAAGPDDTTWQKFPLTTPTTFDLTTSLEGALNSITTGLNVPVGTYAQIRLIPVDSSATLLASASALNAIYNSEVDYTDSANTLHQVPLELQNPDKGFGVATTIQVKGSTTNLFSSTASTATTTATPTTTVDPATGLQETTTPTTTAATTPTTDTTTGVTPAATFMLAINVDGAKDLVPFNYNVVRGTIGATTGTTGAVSGVLLNPHIVAYDQSAVGAIAGTLAVTNLTGLTSTSSYLNIQVTAESLSADGTRHIAVNSAPVTSGGTFTLYPLSTTTSTPTSYDLVIHGPGIATVVVKSVTVNVGDPSTTTPVNIGTITPTVPTTAALTINLNPATPLPAGALVGFYQTLPGSGEVPYLIDAQPIDPFTRTFDTDQSESAGSLNYGTFVSSGSNVTLTSADPTEGAATYRVAGTAPLFTDGPLTTTITSATKTVAVPTLAAASGAALDSATFTISKSSSTQFNRGDLIISRDGAIVATAALDTLLTQGATGSLPISGIPGGSVSGQFADGLYYVSVRVWNTSNPATTLAREIYPAPLDLRGGILRSYSLNID